MRRFLLSVMAVGALGCSSVKESGVCPEASSLSCLSSPECSMDRTRGCKVCQCAKPFENPVAPDKRPTPN
jgi:hypothetical protein